MAPVAGVEVARSETLASKSPGGSSKQILIQWAGLGWWIPEDLGSLAQPRQSGRVS